MFFEENELSMQIGVGWCAVLSNLLLLFEVYVLKSERNRGRWGEGQGVLQLTEGQNKKHELAEHLFRALAFHPPGKYSYL